jgi:adenosylmethionine-8-amino-7-oxononanoate aminotransferase
MNGLRKQLLDDGVYVNTHWNVVLVIPPLIMRPEELEEGFSAIDRALAITDRGVKWD